MSLSRDNPHYERIRAKTAARRLTLSEHEMRELGELVIERTGSWDTLKEDEGRRLADALNCFLAIQYLLEMRNRNAAAKVIR